MHLKHILTTSLLALGSVTATATAQPDPNLPANLGPRDVPMNADSPSGSSFGTPSSSAVYDSQSPSSMAPTSSPTPTSSAMASSSTPSTLQSSTRSSSAYGSSTPASSGYYSSSTPASSGYYSSSTPGASSSSGNLLGGLLGGNSLRVRAEPTPEPTAVAGTPGYMQPAYQPAARPT